MKTKRIIFSIIIIDLLSGVLVGCVEQGNSHGMIADNPSDVVTEIFQLSIHTK